ncbi:MAG: alkaline phosphatase family protein [Candidatus Krumholzibacteriales bacterium]
MDKPLVFIIIDALGYQLAQGHDFSPSGLPVRKRLRTVPGFSQSALTSIFTGCYPDEHSMWMMYSFSRKNSPLKWLSFLPEGVSARRVWLRRLIDWKLRRVDGIKSYYSLYSVPKRILSLIDFPARSNIFLPGGNNRPHSFLDEFYSRGLEIFIRDYHTPEKDSFSHLKSALAEGRFDFYLLYTAGLDAALHKYGMNSKEIENRLGWYRRQLDEILSAAEDMNIVVMGDHGMCDVTGWLDLISRVEELDLRIPEDYIPFYDATMARFRVFSDDAGRELEKLLGGIGEGSVLGKKDKKELGINFENNIFGDIIYLMREGRIINPSYMGESPVKGMHGFHPEADCMYSALFTNMEGADGLESITEVAGLLLPGFRPEGRGGNGTGQDR